MKVDFELKKRVTCFFKLDTLYSTNRVRTEVER